MLLTARKILLVLALAGLYFFLREGPAVAATWGYGITVSNTPGTIGSSATHLKQIGIGATCMPM
ncbi:hypothetical protein [Thermanaeromonas toyohensis]|uniref:hypothetical protein n=1 Tax=Thermanaeromonas toyohensis TaxID=161154 RepID=UPI00156094F7|nr:hypothetical protein [Thermanaeromonas toyohensis]